MAQGSGLAVKLSSRDILVPLYTLGVIGAFMQISGGYWDVSWHTLGLVETFFTQPHSILYTGVTLVLLASVLGLFVRFRAFGNRGQERFLLTGLEIALVGGGLQVIAGPADFWWHSNFGFDPFLFTPSHSLLIIGIILNGFGMAIGSVRLLQAHRSGASLGRYFVSSRLLQLLVVLALTTLWLVMNTFVYLVTDVEGIAYTMGLCNNPTACRETAFFQQTNVPAFVVSIFILAITGTLVLFTAKSVLGWRGAVTAVALLSAVVSASANLGFRALVHLGRGEADGAEIASFMPLYLSFVVPVFLFDILVKDSASKPRMLLAAALIGPFASFLDGWTSLVLWTGVSQLVPILVVPMLAAGLMAGLSRVKFTRVLLPQQPAAITQSR